MSDSRSGALRPVAAVCLAICLALVFHGLVVRGFAIEPTSAADAEAQRGQEVAFLAVIGAVASAVALLVGGRRWAWLAVGVAGVAILAALALELA